MHTQHMDNSERTARLTVLLEMHYQEETGSFVIFLCFSLRTALKILGFDVFSLCKNAQNIRYLDPCWSLEQWRIIVT